MIRPARWFARTVTAALASLCVASAFAQDAAGDKVLRVGYQKAGLLAVVKAQGTLETRVKPLGYTVKWFEFPAGPQLLEALNADSVDIGYTGAPPRCSRRRAACASSTSARSRRRRTTRRSS